MEFYAGAVLDFEVKRRAIEKDYRDAFRSWKEALSSPRPRDDKSDDSAQLELDCSDLAFLCDKLISSKVYAFALLLRRVGVPQAEAASEVAAHNRDLLEETFEYRWLSGLKEHPYFSSERGGSVENKLTSRLWSKLKDPRYGIAPGRLIRDLYSIEADFKELEAYQGIETLKEFIKQHTKGNNRRDPKIPNPDEKNILKAINEGLRGARFCAFSDNFKIKPRQSWLDENRDGPKWPTSYVKAYTSGSVEVRKYWQKKIQDYKNDVQTKFPHLIRRKKLPQHSPTRLGE